jgi:hypothetical protein
MHVIAYASEDQEADRDNDSMLLNIVEKSIKNNERLKINGVLFLHNKIYLQIIEATSRCFRVFDDSITHGFSAYEHNKNYR